MKETEESRRKKKAPCSLLTSKSHRNARSPAMAPSNQTHTLSQACFNTLHAHNRVSNSAVNNWLPCLSLMALLQVYLFFHSLFSLYPLMITLLIKTDPWRMMTCFRWISGTWHHKTSHQRVIIECNVITENCHYRNWNQHIQIPLLTSYITI